MVVSVDFAMSLSAFAVMLSGLPGWPFRGQILEIWSQITLAWPQNFCLDLWLSFGPFPG